MFQNWIKHDYLESRIIYLHFATHITHFAKLLWFSRKVRERIRKEKQLRIDNHQERWKRQILKVTTSFKLGIWPNLGFDIGESSSKNGTTDAAFPSRDNRRLHFRRDFFLGRAARKSLVRLPRPATLVERFDRRGTEPNELFRSEFGQNSCKYLKNFR